MPARHRRIGDMRDDIGEFNLAMFINFSEFN
jgi:hypothetical protein